jgi:hypothetical protein
MVRRPESTVIGILTALSTSRLVLIVKWARVVIDEHLERGVECGLVRRT